MARIDAGNDPAVPSTSAGPEATKSHLARHWREPDPDETGTRRDVQLRTLKETCQKENRDRPTGLDLRGIPLVGEDLHGLNLSGYDLSGADLSGADLRESVLGQARLTGASLSKACLDDCMLFGADLSRANLNVQRQ